MSYRGLGATAASAGVGTIVPLTAREAQTALYTRGFDLGPSGIDGNFGASSQRAMREAIEFALVAPAPSNAFSVSPGNRDVQVLGHIWASVMALPTSRSAASAPRPPATVGPGGSTVTSSLPAPVAALVPSGLPEWLVPALVVGGVVVVGSAVMIGLSRRMKRNRRVRRNGRKRRSAWIRKNGPEVAQIILQQLGGAGRLSMMIAAKNFVDLGNGVMFSFAGKPKTGNKLRITLNGSDLYDVEFWWIRGATMKKLHAVNDVYAEDLKRLIEQHTGLYLSLNGRVRRNATWKAWTGPSGVKEVAEAFRRESGVRNVSAGTEHVYFEYDGDAERDLGHGASSSAVRAFAKRGPHRYQGARAVRSNRRHRRMAA